MLCCLAMSDGSRDACERYIADLFAREDEILAGLRADIAESGLPAIYISATEGRLLQVLLRAVQARRVVEIGTLAGYSAIWIGRALPANGRLVTIERESARADVARRYIERAGLRDRVEVRVGSASETLSDLSREGPFDAVFIDADKEGYPEYLEWCAENVRSGGLVIADNAFLNGRVLQADSPDPEVQAMRQFNRRIATDPRFLSIVVPLRDGVAVAAVR